MDKSFQELKKVFGENRVKQNEPMKSHTTFKIGGLSQYYLEVDRIADIIEAVGLSNKLKIPVFILGGGSNIIVSDKGVRGLVIKNNCRKFDIMRVSGRMKNYAEGWKIDMDKAMVYAESGALMNQLVRFTIEHGFSGLEYQLGLPGTVGGAIFMNSNFPVKQKYVGDALYKARLLTKEGDAKEVDKSYFRFGYDRSILQDTGEILLSAVFQFEPMDKKVLWERGMEALEYRNKTQPKGVSAGCTFRNISIADAINIRTPNNITSAGYLIDKSGLKGKGIGDAVISDVHANFILNKGKATAEDVTRLIDLIKSEVKKKFGVELYLEVKKIGF